MKQMLIWAIDLAGGYGVPPPGLLPLLQKFSEHFNAKVKPIFIFNRQSLGSDISVFTRVYGLDIDDIAHVVFKKFLPSESPDWLEPGHMLMSETYTRRGMIKDLIQMAQVENGKMVITISHSRPAKIPGFLGGFTETLLGMSTIPLLTVRPDFQSLSPIRHILYPSALVQGDRDKFLSVVEFAKSQQAKVTLMFNQLSLDYEYGDFSQFASREAYKQVIENRQKSLTLQLEIGEKLKDIAKTNGVHSDFVCLHEDQSISESILEFSQREKVDLIVMVSRTGPVEGWLLGSNTREVIRQSQCPVWAIPMAA